MNSKAFVVLFFTVALIGAVHATGSIDTNVYNGALNVPLLVRYSSRSLCKLDMKPHTPSPRIMQFLRLGKSHIKLISHLLNKYALSEYFERKNQTSH